MVHLNFKTHWNVPNIKMATKMAATTKISHFDVTSYTFLFI